MANNTVLVTKDGGITTVTLNRPEVLNAIDRDLTDQLADTLRTLEADPAVRCIILTGSGKAFCAGVDLAYLTSLTDNVAFRKFVKDVGLLAALIINLEKPVVAMVNGVAAGAGFNIALACDIVIASRTARFAQSFAKVGLISDCGGMYLLPRLVGPHKAKELMFTADIIDADTALGLGLVNRLADPDALAAVTGEFAARLASGATLALGYMKKIIGRSFDLDLDAILEYGADLQTICAKPDDHREGISAFQQKRVPIFTGK